MLRPYNFRLAIAAGAMRQAEARRLHSRCSAVGDLARSYAGDGWLLAGEETARFQVGQQALDFGVAVQADQVLGDVVGR